MISTTFNGSPAWVLPYAPTWARPVTLRAAVPSESSRSLTGREIRRAFGASLRCTMRWEAYLPPADLADLRNALADYADEPVLVPAWPLVTRGADWPGPVSGGVTIGWADDWSTWELNPATPADWEWVAPVLVGRAVIELPSLRSPGVAMVSLSLDEDGTAAWALAPDSETWATGPALNDSSTPTVFPLGIGWRMQPRSGTPQVEITRRTLGNAPRTRAASYYPQTAFIPVEGSVDCTTPEEVAILLRWWQDRASSTQAHYVTTVAHVTDVAANVSAGATTITVADASALGDYRFLVLDDGIRVQWVRVVSIASNTLTLASAITYAVTAGAATVSVAVLARHAAEDIELAFDRPGFASARLSWEELSEEYVVGSGETRGTTLGAGTLRAWLYKITVDRLGTLTTYRRTSYERDITIASDTWTAAPISHGSFSRSIRLDRDEMVLEARSEAWATVFLPGNLTARVTVDVYECDVSGSTGSNVAQRWSGEVTGISFDGPFVAASCRGPYSVFDRPVPRIVIQPACNHTVYDGGCGLSAATWTFTAAVNATATANTVTLKTWARTAGLPTGWGFANYFALGYLTRGTERFLILSSSSVSGGLVTLSLDRAATWTEDEGVSVVPGCDGMPETCRAYHSSTNTRGKFDNFGKFLGFPFAPAKNPSFAPEKRSTATNGKK
jgi:hypothetical protein